MVDKTQRSKRFFSYAEHIQLPPPLTVMGQKRDGAKACWGNQPIKMVSLWLSQAIVNQADTTPIPTQKQTTHLCLRDLHCFHKGRGRGLYCSLQIL